MAKTSAIQKNLKRIKLVKKYAKKRAALKKIINLRCREQECSLNYCVISLRADTSQLRMEMLRNEHPPQTD